MQNLNFNLMLGIFLGIMFLLSLSSPVIGQTKVASSNGQAFVRPLRMDGEEFFTIKPSFFVLKGEITNTSMGSTWDIDVASEATKEIVAKVRLPLGDMRLFAEGKLIDLEEIFKNSIITRVSDNSLFFSTGWWKTPLCKDFKRGDIFIP